MDRRLPAAWMGPAGSSSIGRPGAARFPRDQPSVYNHAWAASQASPPAAQPPTYVDYPEGRMPTAGPARLTDRVSSDTGPHPTDTLPRTRAPQGRPGSAARVEARLVLGPAPTSAPTPQGVPYVGDSSRLSPSLVSACADPRHLSSVSVGLTGTSTASSSDLMGDDAYAFTRASTSSPAMGRAVATTYPVMLALSLCTGEAAHEKRTKTLL